MIGSGTYTSGGSSQDFTSGSVDVQGSNPTEFIVSGFIGTFQTSVTFSGVTNSDFFTATAENAGVNYDFTNGSYSISDGFAVANNDPQFTSGNLTIGGAPSSVPEPASLALLASPLVALAFVRRRRSRAAA